MYFSRGFARVVKGYEIGRLQRLLGHRVRVAVLPEIMESVKCGI